MKQALRDQVDRDRKVVDLASTMQSVYSFIDVIQDTPQKLEALSDTIKALLTQTAECALFIHEYVGKGFGGK